MDDIEKNTIWKISDCSHLLKQRPSESFVNESIKAVESKLARELGGRINFLELQVDRAREEYKKKHERLEEETKNKMGEYKENFKKVVMK